jgi:hypothetical protein
MSIDFDGISNDFIRVAREQVGAKLSTVRKQGQDVPAVFLSRDTPITPDYPYITFDIITVDDSGSWLIRSGINAEDNPFYASYYRALLSYTVYGDNALSIAHELKGRFRIGRVLDEIKSNTEGVVEDVFAVRSLPQRLSTRFVEVASFSISFGVADTTVDLDAGIIETINLGGESIHTPQTPPENTLDLNISVTDNTI